MRRRQILAGSIATLGGLAGCSALSSESDDVPPPPDKDAEPKQLLPEPPQGWQQVNTRRIGDGISGTTAGHLGLYTPDEVSGYSVGIYKMESKSRADELASQIEEREDHEEFQVMFFVQREIFFFGGSLENGERSKLLMLMDNVDSLTKSLVEDKSLI